MYASLSSPPSRSAEFNIGRHLAWAAVLAVALVGGIGGWASTAHLDAAVVASGVVKVDRELNTVQYSDGGRVAQILVRPGDMLTAGQPMIRMDMAESVAELDLRRAQLADLIARSARLRAERDGSADLQVPSDFLSLHPSAAELLLGEHRLLATGRAQRDNARQSLLLQVEQMDQNAASLASRKAAVQAMLDSGSATLVRAAALVKTGALPATKLKDAEADVARLTADSAELASNIALNISHRKQAVFEIDRIDAETAHTAQQSLREIEPRIAELTEAIQILEGRITRGEIRAPVAGKLNEMPVNTVGQVIAPGATLGTIVPEGAKLVLEFRITPRDIDELSEGQTVRLRFTSFDRNRSPEIAGEITQIAPASTVDSATGANYYLATAQIAPGASLPDGAALVPGMPVEVHATIRARTALEYIMQPLTDVLGRAMVEK
ncbi:MAG: HlyD family type I secretion periplasmic adaptor subunit [bacterium]